MASFSNDFNGNNNDLMEIVKDVETRIDQYMHKRFRDYKIFEENYKYIQNIPFVVEMRRKNEEMQSLLNKCGGVGEKMIDLTISDDEDETQEQPNTEHFITPSVVAPQKIDIVIKKEPIVAAVEETQNNPITVPHIKKIIKKEKTKCDKVETPNTTPIAKPLVIKKIPNKARAEEEAAAAAAAEKLRLEEEAAAEAAAAEKLRLEEEAAAEAAAAEK